ncbi:MAG: hypothetical protein JO006_09470 [Paucibacter sp.]|nr:hypothetical protein [Roseateles sp.]
MKRWLLAVLAFKLSPAAAQAEDHWGFEAMLAGHSIGVHRFVVAGPPDARIVDSRAQFTVRVLGIPVYRYRHEASEQWRGECLRELRSDTDDNGARQHVAQRYEADCLMGFAYWNPHLVTQARLIDPQTGRIEAARFEPVADRPIQVRTQQVVAHGWRLIAGDQRIIVWYAADSGRWIGLDAETSDGQLLTYRLPTAESRP